MPTRRFQPPRAKDSQADQAYSEISQVVDALAPLESYPLRTEKRVNAAAGSCLRLAPRSDGMEVVLPTASGSNFNQTITLFVSSSRGTLRVRATSGTVNGVAAYTLPEGYTTVLVFRSDGQAGWVNERDVVGTDSIVSLVGITGAQGVVDISTLKCGGAVTVSAPTGDWSIAGFTDREPGFWFCCHVANTNFLGTIINEAAANETAIRMTNDFDLNAKAIQGFVFNSPSTLGDASRWRFVADMGNSGAVQRTTTSGLITDFALNPNTRTLEIDTGNTDWQIDSIAGGYAGRKLTIRNSANIAARGMLVESVGSAGTAGNLIICPYNVNRGGYARYSAELEYDGTDDVWRIVSDTGLGVVAVDTNIGIGSVSTSDQSMATLTVAANTINEDAVFEFFGSCHVNRAGTVAACNIVLRFECPANTTVRLTSGNVPLSIVDPFNGTIMMRGTITFGTPGAACPIYVVGEVIDTLRTGSPVTVQLPLPSLVGTVDTTADLAMHIESDNDTALAGVTRTRIGSYIRQIR